MPLQTARISESIDKSQAQSQPKPNVALVEIGTPEMGCFRTKND